MTISTSTRGTAAVVLSNVADTYTERMTVVKRVAGAIARHTESGIPVAAAAAEGLDVSLHGDSKDCGGQEDL